MANSPAGSNMADKILHYANWFLLILSIIAPPLIIFKLVRGLITHTISLKDQFVSQSTQPDVYWIYVFMHCVAVVVFIFFIKRTWKEIRAYESDSRSM
jgi:hypothetical protein